MCQTGVRECLDRLRGQDVTAFRPGEWRAVFDGFGEGRGRPELLEDECPACGEKLFLIRRHLDSVGFNLPDAAVYQGLRVGAPCMALGMVEPGVTTMSRRPSADVRRRWQGMLWDCFNVAFVDVEGGHAGEFAPEEEWGFGDKLSELPAIAGSLRTALQDARRAGDIGRTDDSRATEAALEHVLAPVFARHGFRFIARDRSIPIIRAFWWGHYPDLLFEAPDRRSLAVEVKVTEDWEHPLGEPLACLLAHNAVVNVRVSIQADPVPPSVRSLVGRAEDALRASGRAEFIYVEP